MRTKLIIAVYSRIKIDRILHLAALCSMVAGGAAILFGIFFFTFSSWQGGEEVLASLANSPKKEVQKSFSYSSIGSGSLALKCAAFCPFIQKLKEEMEILAQNTRPDVQNRQREIFIRLKSAGIQLVMESGERIYLEEMENRLKIASSPTSFWIRPVCIEGGGLLLQAEKEGEKGEWLVRASEFLGRRVGDRFWDHEPPLFVKTIKEAKFWGLDFLVQHYAGSEHVHLRDKFKLMIGDHVYFVSKGDFLIWESGYWKLSNETEEAPLAQVKNVTAKGIELDVWDEHGFQTFHIKLDVATFTKTTSSYADQAPTMIRLRTASQITCNLGKRRLILKEGDWLIRTPTGWRKLKTALEIEDCLLHKIRGDLLIFDKLEKLQGKTVLHAHLFDAMRTQVQVLSIPIAPEKKKTSGGKL